MRAISIQLERGVHLLTVVCTFQFELQVKPGASLFNYIRDVDH